MNVRSFTRYSCLYFEKDTNFSKAGQSTYVILPQRPSSCQAGAIMLFNVFIWRAENPVRADKSELGAINRPLQLARLCGRRSSLRPYTFATSFIVKPIEPSLPSAAC